MKRSQFKVLVRRLAELDLAELNQLDAALHGLIETREDETAAPEHTTRGATKAKARGHIELKMINGCGPYKYLRYWQHGRLKSEYIGKA